MYFGGTVKTHSAAKDKFSCLLDNKVLESYVSNNSLTVKNIFSKFKTNVNHIPPIETDHRTNTGCLHSDIVHSRSKLVL